MRGRMTDAIELLRRASVVTEDEAQERNPKARKRPSGSETRQRSRVVGFRATAAEETQLALAADRAGLTVSSYVRAQSLAAPTTRAMRSPPVNKAALAQLLGHIGQVGSNVNQIARQLNSGRNPEEIADIAATLRAVREMRDAVLLALGMRAATPNHPATVERL
jgi:Bacterial mobilisation protein (MobC)